MPFSALEPDALKGSGELYIKPEVVGPVESSTDIPGKWEIIAPNLAGCLSQKD
jgi:hypothetical protein